MCSIDSLLQEADPDRWATEDDYKKQDWLYEELDKQLKELQPLEKQQSYKLQAAKS